MTQSNSLTPRQYAEIAKGIKNKTPVSLVDISLALGNLAAVVNIQRF